jgi:hypothetical protein
MNTGFESGRNSGSRGRTYLGRGDYTASCLNRVMSCYFMVRVLPLGVSAEVGYSPSRGVCRCPWPDLAADEGRGMVDCN